MKFAVMSDLHGNYEALRAFIEYIGKIGVDGVFCLGDLVTDGPYPRRTMDAVYGMLERYPSYVVKGNREQYLIDNFYKDMGWKPSSAGGSLWYTARDMEEADIRFMEKLPELERVELSGLPGLTLCHGTPGRLRGNVELEEGLLDQVLGELETPWLLGGHSHRQEIRKVCGKTYLNPGSLGLAADGVGRQAQFAVLTGQAGVWRPELVSIPYDVDRQLADFRDSGLAACGGVLSRAVCKWMVTGINYFYLIVEEACAMTGREPDTIPEEVWEGLGKKYEL